MSEPLSLGLDLSTQQLKSLLINERAVVVYDLAVGYDRDLPQYGTTNGAIYGPAAGHVTSPVAMWVQALDLILQRMKDAGVDFSRIRAVSGAGQQHGSVYWSTTAEDSLASLDPSKTLLSQLVPNAFSIHSSPIWQDSSTTRECRNLEDIIGGPQALADLTGSRAYERFTGAQIKKIRTERPDEYVKTARISLVSSFLPSLFLGSIAPIEVSDASGMNLMDIAHCRWDERLLRACGGTELKAKIGPEPVLGGTVLGKVSSWWVKRWGFHPDCLVTSFTGDNPATMVALSTPGDAVLSLGTSTTLLLAIPPSDTPPARFTTSHLLAHPTTAGAHIAMLCYKNGSLAREKVRNEYASGDWARFNELVAARTPGNEGYWGLYFPLPEIIPPNVIGNFYFKSEDGLTAPTPVEKLPDRAHPRAIVESQLLSIRARVAAILQQDTPHLRRLVLTGGASTNPIIRQLFADLFGIPVYVPEDTSEAAATGGALLARYAWRRSNGGFGGTFEEMRAGDADRMKLVAQPDKEITKVYDRLVEAYTLCEDFVVKACDKA
ncbi:actin-like ATPase domain-containing protein [Russula earlei]|uniref:Actin-like ATPase domain-containing protein n=1 Tax=Russula earlei TaxID=71964 RepID=A0ACC0UFY2_9AGAM|nr:actin-like ATPase domain-containing protein [Russula earlei]